MPDNKLDILIDVRSRLDDLVKAQNELRKLGKEANSAGQALQTGFGIETARRGLNLLTSTLKESIFEAFHMADAIKDASKNLGLSTDAYQVLGNVLNDAGGDAALLTMMISQNDRSLVEARNSASAAAAAYRTLGLDIAQLESMPKEKRMELYGRAVAGSKDQTLAFSAASQILGTRNLPTVLGALKDLANDGYANLDAAMKKSGRVMQEDTIIRLEAAKKTVEKAKQEMTIATGEGIGFAGALLTSFKKSPLGTLGDLLNPSMGHANLLLRLGRDNPSETKPPGGDDGEAARIKALTDAQTKAEYDLAAAILHRNTIEGNPNLTEFQKLPEKIRLMREELKLREALLAATKAMPFGGVGEDTKEAHELKIKKMEEQNAALRLQLRHDKLSSPSRDRETQVLDGYAQFQQDGGIGSPGVGRSLLLGAKEWVTSIGTAGEQVAQTLQGTLGAAVSGITDGIYGWITGTQTFGQAMAQLGGTVLKMILQTIVQMGVQMLVNAVIGRAIQAASIAANIATASGTAVALSAIWAVPATLATIASFGGAAAAAPAEIALANAITLGAGGFKVGGYTGDGPEDQIAGYVHGKEGVLNAPAMKFLGRGFLNAMNKGDYASAANAAPAFGGSGGSGALGSRESGRNIHVYLDRSAWLDAVSNDLTGIAHEVFEQRARA